jgi:hypothetical protein
MLTRDRILSLFTELDAELCQAGVRGDVFIVGGAAMTVAYDARPATRDVDGIWHPSTAVRQAAAQVAARHDDIDTDWLNDAVKGTAHTTSIKRSSHGRRSNKTGRTLDSMSYGHIRDGRRGRNPTS